MLRKGFFTSDSWTINGDGFVIGNNAEGSDFLAKMLALSVSNGVPYLPSSNLRVQATTGMILSVGAGLAMKNGYMAWETTNASITCTSSESEQTLYISHRFDLGNNEITGDSVDKYTTFDPVTDLCYAIVVIPANAVTITDAMIADVRSQAAYCGYITDQREYLEDLIAEIQEQLSNVIGGGMPDHASTHATGGDDPLQAPYDEFTLDAEDWSDDEYEITATDVPLLGDITANTIVRVLPASDSTADEREAWRAALIVHGGQIAATSITLLADGGAPTVDIPIRIILGGELV